MEPQPCWNHAQALLLKWKRSPSAISTHCLIHHQVLATKTLPSQLQNHLNIMIKIINHTKPSALNTKLFVVMSRLTEHETLHFHTNVHWHSKGSMLGRLYELREEVTMFLDWEKKMTTSPHLIQVSLSLAYLAHISEALNALNWQLHGRNTTMTAQRDAIHTFVGRLQLWKRRIQKRKQQLFLICTKSWMRQTSVTVLKPRLWMTFKDWKMSFIVIIREELWNESCQEPRPSEVDDVPEALREEFLKLKFNSVAKGWFYL